MTRQAFLTKPEGVRRETWQGQAAIAAAEQREEAGRDDARGWPVIGSAGVGREIEPVRGALVAGDNGALRDKLARLPVAGKRFAPELLAKSPK